MKFILIAVFIGSGSGPTAPVVTTAEFDDKPACEAGAQALDRLTRTARVMYSKVTFECVPKGTAAQ